MLQEITNPIVMDRGFVPTPDGLLSTEIFGTTMIDRRQTFAYINLNCHVLQPLVYKMLRRLDRRIDHILAGSQTYKIDAKGQLVEDPNGGTGSEWLYANWSKIKWKRNDSKIRNERLDLLDAHTRDEIFQDKEIVCPAFYRDVNLQSSKAGRPSIHEINHPYSKLIRFASALNQGDFAFNLHYTKFMIQKTLVEIYDYFKNKIDKKRGIIKNNLLGKSVDYGARVVIGTANFTYNRMEDMPVNTFHAGIPLSYCISMLTPFFAGWVQNFFWREFEARGMKYPVYSKSKKEIEYLQIQDPAIQFSDEKVRDLMTKYIYSYNERFDPVMIETTNKDYPLIPIHFKGYSPSDSDFDIDDEDKLLNRRFFTLTDLFYIAACDICKDKHVYITRYPMKEHLGIFPIRISVLTTNEVTEMKVNDTIYKHYPVINVNTPKDDVPNKFIEVVQLPNTYLQAIGGN